MALCLRYVVEVVVSVVVEARDGEWCLYGALSVSTLNQAARITQVSSWNGHVHGHQYTSLGELRNP